MSLTQILTLISRADC